MSWYKSGTIGVTNGSPVVTGTGSNFIEGANVGEAVQIDDVLYEILSIESATSLTLATNYIGSTQSGEAYAIVPTQGLVANLATQVKNLITDYTDVKDGIVSTVKAGDGSLTAPSVTFNSDQNNGLYKIGADNWGLVAGGSKIVAVSTSGIDVTGDLKLGDNNKATFGVGDDLQLFHDGSNSYLLENGLGNLNVQATGSTYIKSSDGTLTSAQFIPQTEVRLFYSNDQKFRTTSTGCDVTGTATMEGLVVASSAGTAYIAQTNTDNSQELELGNAYTIVPAVGGGYSAVNSNGGPLVLGTDGIQRQRVANNGDISFYEDTGTTPKLFWDASAEKLNLSGTGGLDVTGTATMDSIEVGGSLQIGSGNSSVKLSTFNSNNTDIAALTNDSDFGGLIEGGTNGSLVVGIRGNDSTDGFYILSGSGNYMTDDTYDRVVFKVDAAGNVGIGTSSPAATLDVTGSGAEIAIRDTRNSSFTVGDTVASLGFYSNDTSGSSGSTPNLARGAIDLVTTSIFGSTHDMVFKTRGDVSTGAVEHLRITSAGKVGIGTSSPASLVSGGSSPVLSIGGTDTALTTGDKSGSVSFITNDPSFTGTYSDGIAGEIASVAESAVGGAYGLAFYTGTTGSAGRSEQVRISNNGNVGIGTDSPSQALDVVGSIEVSDGIYLGGTGAANKLDDYEEGTWTPTLIGSTSGSATLTIATNSYTKIGNTVRLDCYLTAADVTGLSGSVRLGGLPFNASGYSPVSITHCTLFSFDESDGVGGFTENGGAYVNLVFGSSSAVIPHTSANATSGTMMATLIYKTNS